MIYKELAVRSRKCKQCGNEIKADTECFITTSSGNYNHTICKKCVMKEVNKKVGKSE